MTDTLITIAAIAIGSTIWFAIQIAAWSIWIRGYSAYRFAQRVVIGVTIVAPMFVLLVEFVSYLFGRPVSVAEFLLNPIATAWILLVSWAGLWVAAHWKGVSTSPTQPENGADNYNEQRGRDIPTP